MAAAHRVVVTGASGVLGRAVVSHLESRGHHVVGTAYSRSHDGKFTLLDLCDRTATSTFLSQHSPDVIIHCAAERRPDVMEQDEQKCRQLNVSATRDLCQLARDLGAWVLYISSDYVFDGTSPPYRESADGTHPLNKYGRSKLDGETETLAASAQFAVLRVPVLYGHVERLEESAVTVLFRHVLQTGTRCVMSHYERRYPTSVHDLARVVDQMIRQHTRLHGYFHWSGREEMTKYDMAVTMATMFDLPTDHIVADEEPTGGASRPYNAQLECKRLEEFGIGREYTSFKDGIKDCLQPWAKETKVKVKITVDN